MPPKDKTDPIKKKGEPEEEDKMRIRRLCRMKNPDPENLDEGSYDTQTQIRKAE